MFHNLSGRLRLMINLVSGEIILCLEKCNLKKYSMSGRKQLQKSGRKHNHQSVWKVVSGTLCLEENHSRGKCLEKCVWKSAPPPSLRLHITTTKEEGFYIVLFLYVPSPLSWSRKREGHSKQKIGLFTKM